MRSKYERLAAIENILLDELILKVRELSYFLKAGFNPDQPRIPSRNSNGGQWAGGGGTLSKVPDSWANPETLKKKFGKHSSDFGVKTQKEYAKKAQQFRTRAIREKLPALEYGRGKEIGLYYVTEWGWQFYEPQEGYTIRINDVEALYSFTAADGWVLSVGFENIDELGVNATADSTNRLSVSSPAILFNHETDDIQVKVNKAAAGDNASFLFQTGFSGRAEIGLTGDDDFHFKVSPDGSTWHNAITIDKTTGNVTISGGGSYSADGSTLQLVGSTFSVKDVELLALAGLTSASNKLPYFTGSGTASLADLSSFGRSIIDDADASAARTTLGLVIGTDVQAQDAELAAIAGLTSAADKLPYFTGSGTAALADITSTARSLLDDNSASAMRTTLGLVIGTNVQAYDSDLDNWAGKTAPSGAAVGTSDTQTLTNKTINGSNNTITNVSLTSGVTGVLPVANGGTNASTAIESARNLGGCYIIGQSAVAASVGAVTTEATLATITVPANALGANGFIEIITFWTYTNSANNKTKRIRWGGASGDIMRSLVSTTTITNIINGGWGNRNATNSQVGFISQTNSNGWSSSTSALMTSAKDTTLSQDIVITGQKASSGETLTLEGYIVKLYPK